VICWQHWGHSWVNNCLGFFCKHYDLSFKFIDKCQEVKSGWVGGFRACTVSELLFASSISIASFEGGVPLLAHKEATALIICATALARIVFS